MIADLLNILKTILCESIKSNYFSSYKMTNVYRYQNVIATGIQSTLLVQTDLLTSLVSQESDSMTASHLNTNATPGKSLY